MINIPQTSAYHICDLLNGELIGLKDRTIKGIGAINEEAEDVLTFLTDDKYQKHLKAQRSSTILVQEVIEGLDDTVTFIKVLDVTQAMHVISLIYNDGHALTAFKSPKRLSAHTVINGVATQIGECVSLGHYTVIGDNVSIGRDTWIGSHVYIGDDVVIGQNVTIMTGVKIMHKTIIGDHCVIHPNAVIGSQGFGFYHDGTEYQRRAHLGRVVIEDQVEIGANTCIDRGTVKDTIIKRGVKLDNLIQIAHGVEVGEGVAIAALAGIAGSTKIGAYSQVGGQVGMIGHIDIAPHSKIQAKSGIAGDIHEAGQKWYGYPAIPYVQYLRSFALFRRLPELFERLIKLEKGSKGQ